MVANIENQRQRQAPQDDAVSLDDRACRIAESLSLYEGFFGEMECRQIEEFADATAVRAATGRFKGERTVDSTPRRTKYFFGNGYTYGAGNKGNEELLPEGEVDPIPNWIQQLVIAPLVQNGFVPKGWIDSVVMNDYQAGGSIVAHVDPIQLFARPIITTSFFCPARLVFGASFDPERKQPPVYMQPLPRGSVLWLDGYAADKETHGMRPEDMFGTRRLSIVLRHVHNEAPRINATTEQQRTPLGQEERSRLIRHVQGRWRDPAGRFSFSVQHLTVHVSEVRNGDERKHKATWQIIPRECGLVCNGGILDSTGASQTQLQWRPIVKKRGSDFAWIWFREVSQNP
jgi:alkylated DNA repair protein alkB family protein 5